MDWTELTVTGKTARAMATGKHTPDQGFVAHSGQYVYFGVLTDAVEVIMFAENSSWEDRYMQTIGK
jgi:hypothetical protein